MFQISPLPAAGFADLFGLPDDELAARGVVVKTAAAGDRMPCRISLRDARPGERALLVNFQHQPAASPYRSNYAIYVVEGAEEARLAPDELPEVFMGRPLAVRAFDADGMLVEAGMAMGADVKPVIEALLLLEGVAYLHVHNAMHGCYAARVDRIAG